MRHPRHRPPAAMQKSSRVGHSARLRQPCLWAKTYTLVPDFGPQTSAFTHKALPSFRFCPQAYKWTLVGISPPSVLEGGVVARGMRKDLVQRFQRAERRAPGNRAVELRRPPFACRCRTKGTHLACAKGLCARRIPESAQAAAAGVANYAHTRITASYMGLLRHLCGHRPQALGFPSPHWCNPCRNNTQRPGA